jgi:hypothetical protein
MRQLGSLSALLRSPSAEAVWALRVELLAAGLDPEHRVFRLLGGLHRFLDRLETGSASRDHSERASLMEVGSLSGVVAGELLDAQNPAERARRILGGALTEGLAVLATRQHVRAWRGELASVYRDAAWTLYDELWRWAAARKPELDPAERVRLVEQLLQPLRADGDGSSETAKAVLACSLFVLLVVDALADVSAASD